MATVGGGAAYTRLQVPEDGISQGLQYWGGIKAQENAAKEASGERAKERAAAALKEGLKDFDFDYSKVVGKMTGQKDFDAVTRTYAENVVEKMTKASAEGKRLFAAGDLEGANRELAKAQKMQASLGSWNSMSEKVGAALLKDMEDASNGLKNPNDHRSKIMDSILKNNYIPDVDENGNFTMLVGIDMNDDQIVSKEEREAGMKFMKDGIQVEGYEFVKVDPYKIVDGDFRVYNKVDTTGDKGLFNQLKATAGYLKQDKDTGNYMKTTTKGWDESKKPLMEAAADGMLANEETLAWVLTEATKGESKKIEGFTKEEKKVAKDYLVNGAIATFETEKTTDFDSGRASIAMQREALRKAEDGDYITAHPMTDASGRLLNSLKRLHGINYKEADLYTLKTKDGKGIKGIMDSDVNAEILDLAVTKDGKYYATVRSTKNVSTKGSTGSMIDIESESGDVTTKEVETVTNTVQLKDTEGNRLARRMGLETTGDMTANLKSSQNAFLERTKQNAPAGGASRFNKKK